MIRIWIKENVTKCMLFMWIIFIYFSLERGYITALAFNWFNECDVRGVDGWNLAWSKLLYGYRLDTEVGMSERPQWDCTPVLVLRKEWRNEKIFCFLHYSSLLMYSLQAFAFLARPANWRHNRQSRRLEHLEKWRNTNFIFRQAAEGQGLKLERT